MQLGCLHCDGLMGKKTISGRGAVSRLVALLVGFFGVLFCLAAMLSFWALPVGLIMIAMSVMVDGPVRRVWRCQRCGSTVERY